MSLFLVQVTSPPTTKNTSRRVDLHLLNTVGGRQPPCLFWAPTLLRDAASASGAYVNTLNITTSSPQGNSAGRRRTLSTFQSGWRFVFVSWSRAALLTEQRCFYQTQPEPPRRYWRRFLLVFSWRFAACWRFPSSTVLHSYSHRSTSFTISFSSRTEESSVCCRAATNDSSWINFSKFYSLQMSLLVPTVQNQKRELQCSSAQGPAAPLVFSAQTFKSPRQTPRSHAEDLGFNKV